MGQMTKQAGSHMAAEIEEALGVFATAARQDVTKAVAATGLPEARAFYTVARGSSDAAANILSYEFMRVLERPVTSLPPSVFSLGEGVDMTGAAAIAISQSGASDDLVRTVKGIRKRGGAVVAITNQSGSAVEAEAQVTLPIWAGPELAVPATKTVIGSVAAGLALLAAISPDYRADLDRTIAAIEGLTDATHPHQAQIVSALLRAQHVYVIGREAGYGAAHEIALKIKETCAIHAEAYSSSEVLHGPLQLVSRPLMVLMLDTGQDRVQASLDTAEARFTASGATVWRVRPSDVGANELTPAGAAALLLRMVYPVILATAIALGHDPDAPSTLSKVTQTT